MKKLYIIFFLFYNFLELQAQIAFTDVTTTAGIAFNSLTVESLAWGDYDNDGDQDLFLATNGLNKLMRNDGNDIFTDVSAVMGITENFVSTGCAFGDFDNDGNLDLYVVSLSGTDPDLLYKNLGVASNYAFQSIAGSVSGITNTETARGVALFDYNRDGLIDIYLNTTGKEIVYKNTGNFIFQEVSTSIGINISNIGVGAVPTDINNDGWIDVFTGNRSSDPNTLFVNDGTGNFSDRTAFAGISAVGLGMGVIAFDYDNDLDMDLYWTAWPGSSPSQPNAFYQNQGNGTFLNKTADTKTADVTGWGISCNSGDIDNDSFEDFFVANGFSTSSSASILFRNNNGIDFQDITLSALGNLGWDGRGVAFADYDNDGDLDICLTGGVNSDTKLWRNDSTNSNNWVTFNLKGTQSNVSAIGTRIELSTGGITTVKEVSGGAGRGSFNSLPVEFGLGSASVIDSIRVRWTNGTSEKFTNININQNIDIVEGSGTTLSVSSVILNNLNIKAYPNPFKNIITLDLSTLTGKSTVKIYNSLGQLIYKNLKVENKKIDIDIEESFKGILYMSIKHGGTTIVRKIVKN